MKDIFFHERGKQILMSLSKGDKYVSEIANDIGATYAHTFNLIKTMQKRGIIAAEKKGRTKYVKLTQKGLDLAAALTQFLEVINAPASEFRKRGKPGTGGKKKITVAKSVKVAEAPTETTTNKRLRSYIDALNKLLINLKSEPQPTKSGMHARLAGRYRFLINRQRPRDQVGKGLKAEAAGLLDELSKILES